MTSGIYLITNRVTGEQYVGKSVDIAARWAVHQKNMTSPQSYSSYASAKWLIESAKLHGIEAFSFSVLEECEKSILSSKEMCWIKQIEPVLNDDTFISGKRVYKSWLENFRQRYGRDPAA